MNIEQWIYTSTCWGIEKQNGFQVFSYSKGLSEADSDEIFKLIGCYDFPNSLEYESYKQFPVSFCHLRLSSGNWLLARTTPLGAGWVDGRPGNFIVHALISSQPFPGNVMTYYNSPAFWTDMPEEVKKTGLQIRNEEIPWRSYGYLPTLTDSAIQSQDAEMTLESLEKWAERNKAMDKLAVLIDAYINRPTDEQRPILVRDSKDDIPKLFALLLYYFPEYISKSITFNTYLDASYKTPDWLSHYNFIGVLSGDFDLDFRYDFQTVKSPVFEVQRQFRSDFQNWCVNLGIPIENLCAAASTFHLVRNGMINITLEQLETVTDFLFKFDKRGELTIHLIDGIINNKDTLITETSYEKIMDILFNCLPYLNDRNKFVNAIQSLFSLKLIEFFSSSRFEELYDYTAQKFGYASFYKYWISKENLDRINTNSQNFTSPDIAYNVLNSLKNAEADYQYLKQNMPDTLPILISQVRLNNTYFTEYLKSFSNSELLDLWKAYPAQDKIIARAIASVLETKSAQGAIDLRQKMLASHLYEHLWEEFQLQSNCHTPQGFISYSKNIFDSDKKYKELYFENALSFVQFRQIQNNDELKWLLNEISKLTPQSKTNVLQSIENSLSFQRPDENSQSFLYKLQEFESKELAEDKKPYTISRFLIESVAISQFNEKVAPCQNGYELEVWLKHWQKLFVSFSPSQQKEWGTWWLSNIFDIPARKFTPGIHKAILGFLFSLSSSNNAHASSTENNCDNWIDFYVQNLELKLKSSVTPCYYHNTVFQLLDYVLTLLPEEYFAKMSDSLINTIFASCKKDGLRAIRVRVESEVFRGLSKRALDKAKSRWNDFEQKFIQSRGFTSNIKRLGETVFNFFTHKK